MSAPVFSRPRFLPGSKINGAQIDHAVVSDGCIINHSKIIHCIVGIRSVVGAGSELNRVIHLGCDYYESHRLHPRKRETRPPPHRHRTKHPHRKRHH